MQTRIEDMYLDEAFARVHQQQQAMAAAPSPVSSSLSSASPTPSPPPSHAPSPATTMKSNSGGLLDGSGNDWERQQPPTSATLLEPKPHHQQPSHPTGCSPPPSFGQLFERVCREKKSGARQLFDTPLFQWHKANLEVGCGASLEGLGWLWNEDEPYGFDGSHAALQSSWKPPSGPPLLVGPLLLCNAPIQKSWG